MRHSCQSVERFSIATFIFFAEALALGIIAFFLCSKIISYFQHKMDSQSQVSDLITAFLYVGGMVSKYVQKMLQ